MIGCWVAIPLGHLGNDLKSPKIYYIICILFYSIVQIYCCNKKKKKNLLADRMLINFFIKDQNLINKNYF